MAQARCGSVLAVVRRGRFPGALAVAAALALSACGDDAASSDVMVAPPPIDAEGPAMARRLGPDTAEVSTRRYGAWLSVQSPTTFAAGTMATVTVEVPMAGDPAISSVVLTLNSPIFDMHAYVPRGCWTFTDDRDHRTELVCQVGEWNALQFTFPVPESGTFDIDYLIERDGRLVVLHGPITEEYTVTSG